jgi:hypothetical protein
MEKKGEILNQLAIIADLIEKVNLNYNSATIVFNVKENEFKRIYNYTSRKNGDKFIELKDDVRDFLITINNVHVKINKSNV